MLDLLEPMGELSYKPLFGGYAICKHDAAFALVFDGAVYFKTDTTNRKDYESYNSNPLTYRKQGKKELMVFHFLRQEKILYQVFKVSQIQKKLFKVIFKLSAKLSLYLLILTKHSETRGGISEEIIIILYFFGQIVFSSKRLTNSLSLSDRFAILMSN